MSVSASFDTTPPAGRDTFLKPYLSPIADLVEDARRGRMFILVDAEDRENEGDLVIPATAASPEAINFMAKHGRGLICLALTSARIDALGLGQMSRHNQSRHETAFTVSIEAREGISTGISAHDRARTIAVAIDPEKTAADLVTPGHVFPLRARDGGVLERTGHTEAAVDLARLAGHTPAGVICEIMSDDGSMAKAPELVRFAEQHQLKIGTIEDLIAYRIEYDHPLTRKYTQDFPSAFGSGFQMIVFEDKVSGNEHFALVKGDIKPDAAVLTRIQRINVAKDLLGYGGTTSNGLERAMRAIDQAGGGAVVIIRDVGAEVVLPDQRRDAVEPTGRRAAGGRIKSEFRDFGIGAQILRDLGIKKLRLITNSPQRRIVGLDAFDLQIVEQITL